ncbi:MAG: oligosaccharide flippase family protein [Spirochaetes bacterium]|nr:oligosaccharide flippase family protein [Spirochaetota bacterium]
MIKKTILHYIDLVIDVRRGIIDIIATATSQGLGIIIATITSILVARALGPDSMGKYSLILSVTTFIFAITDLGISQTTIRYASKAISLNDVENHRAILRWSLRIRLAILMVTASAVYLITPFITGSVWHVDGIDTLIRLSLFIVLFMIIGTIATLYFQSLKRFMQNAIITSVISILTFSGIIALYYLKLLKIDNIIWYTVISSGVLTIMAALIFLPKDAFVPTHFLTKKYRFDIKNILHTPSLGEQPGLDESDSMKTFAFFSSISSFVIAIGMQMDIWILGAFIPTAEVGIYSVGIKYAMPLATFMATVSTVLWPRISPISKYEELISALKKMIKLGIVLMIPFALYSIFVPMLTPWLFGKAYSGSILYGQILSIRYCISIFTTILLLVGYNIGLIRTFSIITPITIVFWIIVNIVVVSRFGAMGAAIDMVLAEILWLIILILLIRSKLKSHALNN